jgi:glycosyltransferase involved in cell wall biosynthesis
MPSVTFLVAGALDARTGGSIYNRRMADALTRNGWHVEVRELDATFPRPTVTARQHAADTLSQVPDGRTTVVDGLAYGAMPEVVAPHADRLRLIPIIHLPLAAAADLTPAAAACLADAERRALASAARVIVTGEATLALLRELQLTHHDVHVVEPGTDVRPLAAGTRGQNVHVLCVAAVTPGKGHRELMMALAAVPGRNWQLTCAGSLSRAPDLVREVRAVIAELNLTDRVMLEGELDESTLDGCYHHADVVVSASLRETYGMAVAEALARGLPVVATATGAAADLVSRDAGIVVPPGDVRALTGALTLMLGEAGARARYAAGARRVRGCLPSWDRAAVTFAQVLEASPRGLSTAEAADD